MQAELDTLVSIARKYGTFLTEGEVSQDYRSKDFHINGQNFHPPVRTLEHQETDNKVTKAYIWPYCVLVQVWEGAPGGCFYFLRF